MARTLPLLAASSLLVLSAIAPAQTQVIPADFATTEAPSSTNFPFGLSTPARVQYIYGARETGLPTAMFIRTLNLRADGASAHLQKNNIDLQISMSTTPVTVGTASSTFSANHGSNLTVVYTRKLTTLGATAAGSPGGYGGTLVLDTPFFYDANAGNLVIDFDVQSQPAGSWPMDTPYTTAGTHTNFGTACGNLSATSSGGALGTAANFGVSGGVPNNPAVLLLGTTQIPGGIPLPGSPGCFLYNDVLASVATTLSALGAANIPLTVPPAPGLRGLTLHSQWAALNANFVFQTSQTRSVTLASWVVLRVHDTTSNTSLTGTVQNYVGIVIELG